MLHQDARVPDGRRCRDRSRVVEEEGDLAPAAVVVLDVLAALEPVREAGEEAQRDAVDATEDLRDEEEDGVALGEAVAVVAVLLRDKADARRVVVDTVGRQTALLDADCTVSYCTVRWRAAPPLPLA